MPSLSQKLKRGFTLTELTVYCVIVFILLIVLYPVFARGGIRSRRNISGASNQKVITLAFLQYIQDYDDRFPPVVRYTYPTDPKTGEQDSTHGKFAQSWGPDRILPDGRIVPGLLSLYTKSNAVFQYAGKKPHQQPTTLCFMYNDLMAGEKQDDLNQVSETVLITNAEDRLANVGHAYTPTSGPFSATFNSHDTCVPGKGASIREARTEREGGANFAFSDGHVKWHTAGINDAVFFPPREYTSPSAVDAKTHRQIGPIPGSAMVFQGRKYVATFHLR